MTPLHEIPKDIDISNYPDHVVRAMHGLVSLKTAERKAARKQLIKNGDGILPYIHDMVCSDNKQLRWEAAQILKHFASESSMSSLIHMMADHESSIRWIAGETLIKLGRISLGPLLKELIDKSSNSNFRDGALRVLKGILTEEEKIHYNELLDGLYNYQKFGHAVPVLAGNARRELEKKN